MATTNFSSGTIIQSDWLNDVDEWTYGDKVIVANTSNPALTITQTGTGNAFVVEDSTTPDSTPFVIDNAGNGISGATSVTTVSAGGAPRFQAHGLLGYSGINNGADTLPTIAEYSKNRGGAIVNSGDQVGQLRFSAFDGTNYIRAAAITAEVDGTPGTDDMPGRLLLSTTADGASTPTERMRIDSAGNVGIGGTPGSNTRLTVAGSSSIAGLKVSNIKETITVSATAATGTVLYDIATQSVLYYTTNASANWIVNFRGSGGTSLNSFMSPGESMTVTFMVTQGATAYYNTSITVDGVAVTPKWAGGVAPSAGNANSVDLYSYTIIKTGSAAFTVLASQSKFA